MRMHGFRGPRVARLSLGLVLATVLIVAGCAGTPGGAGGGGGGGAGGGGGGALTGRTFLSESVTEHGRPRPLVAGTRIRLSFTESGYVTASAGCNLLSGPVRVERNRLVVGDLSSTDMACSPELGAQDEWLAGVLAADPAYVLHGARLRLTAGGTVIGLVDREVAEPDVPLESATWHLEGIADGDAVSSVPAGAGADLTFRDGQVLVQVEHCNQGGGDVVIGESTLTVGPLRMTRMACQQGPAEVEAAVTEVLAGTITYATDADVLTLTHPGGQGLVLRAEWSR
jgi:heat shock protein HslJ